MTASVSERELRSDLESSLRELDDFRAERISGWTSSLGLVEEFSRIARSVADDSAALAGYLRHFPSATTRSVAS